MGFRSSLLGLLALALAFNGAGATAAHVQRTAPQGTQSVLDVPVVPMDADCAGHEHAVHGPALEVPADGVASQGEDSGDDCCKGQSCGCGCVGPNMSSLAVPAATAPVMTHRMVVNVVAAVYVPPVLPHLIRPPISPARHAP